MKKWERFIKQKTSWDRRAILPMFTNWNALVSESYGIHSMQLKVKSGKLEGEIYFFLDIEE